MENRSTCSKKCRAAGSSNKLGDAVSNMLANVRSSSGAAWEAGSSASPLTIAWYARLACPNTIRPWTATETARSRRWRRATTSSTISPVTAKTKRLETTEPVSECRSHQARNPATHKSPATNPRRVSATTAAAIQRTRDFTPESSHAAGCTTLVHRRTGMCRSLWPPVPVLPNDLAVDGHRSASMSLRLPSGNPPTRRVRLDNGPR